MQYYSAIKKNKIMPLQQYGWTYRVSYCVKSDREGEISCDIPCIWNLKRNDTNELTKQKKIHRLRK